MNKSLAKILKPAYGPCPAFSGPCAEMRWNPDEGHVPRGFLGATGTLSEVELVLVFAEPGDPQESEAHTGLKSAYDFATYAFRTGMDLFHRNVREILSLCWPHLDFGEQLRKVWMTESVLCSAKTEGGAVKAAVWRECGNRYLRKQINFFPNALIVALGSKARTRLHKLGLQGVLSVYAAAPPGCNRPQARESWKRIPAALRRHQRERVS